MPDPTKQSTFAPSERMQEAMEHMLRPAPETDDALHAKLDRIIALLERAPRSTAILTGVAVNEVMTELARRNRL